MPTSIRANRLSLQIPDGWADETVYAFRSTDRQEKVTLKIEKRSRQSSLDDDLMEKTASVRAGIPGAKLGATGDTTFARLPAKYFMIEGLRGDEVPIVYYCVLAKPLPLELLVFDYAGPADHWKRASTQLQAIMQSAVFAGE